MAELISLIVSTYNRPDALEAALRGLARQTDRGFEVVIADDGSGPDTARLVARHAAASGFELAHVWQADEGFRAAEIRNRAVMRSRGDYCIFLDGDCVPRPDFVAAHRRLAEPSWFVAGNRILLSPALSERILSEGIKAETWSLADLVRERLKGGVNRLAPALRLPLGPLRRLNHGAWQGARSCNLAMWRRDFDKVDGFDAAFSGWGLEDSDIVVRLLRSGARRKDGRFSTGVLHLWHPEADRSCLRDNQDRLDAVMAAGRIRAMRGLSSLDAPGASEAPAASPARP